MLSFLKLVFIFLRQKGHQSFPLLLNQTRVISVSKSVWYVPYDGCLYKVYSVILTENTENIAAVYNLRNKSSIQV